MKSDRVATYFYIVLDEQGRTYRHSTLDTAKEDAKNLARSNPGQSFVVMEAVVAYLVDNIVEVEYTAAHNNPDDPNHIKF
jgi:hypothetical protein